MKRTGAILVAGAVAAGVLIYTQYNKPHKDYSEQEVARSWKAEELATWYATHPAEQHSKWQEKVVAVSGTVASGSESGLVLEHGIVVTWDPGSAPSTPPKGDIQVKGRVVGFDDLFGEVRLDHAWLSE
ncbi:MAG: hypothetical protein ACPG6N_05220 [Flavobacteriales bacterium]